MYTNPSILKIWQHADDSEILPPTCYDARNPAMPWLPADELAYEDDEDRAIARDWVCTGGPAESIGALQKRTKQPMAPSTAIVPPTPDIFQLTSLQQQLAHPATSRKKIAATGRIGAGAAQPHVEQARNGKRQTK